VLYSFFINEKLIINISYGWIIFGLFLSHFIHEWGHVLSAKSFNIKPKEIGFGIYYVIPVFYTDLSDAWNISSRNRIIINLSGIYFEYLIALFCYMLFLLSNNNFFIILATLIFIKTWYNLNPIIQSDMYWVLSDIMKRPNLNDDALDSINNPVKLFKYLFNFKKNILEIILFVYGISILCFWLYIIYKFFYVGKSLISRIPENYIQISNMIRNNQFELDSLFSILYNFIFIFFIIFILFVSLKRLFLFIFQSRFMKEANEKRKIL
jgi:putative peptide zinc metalloprotease protein